MIEQQQQQQILNMIANKYYSHHHHQHHLQLHNSSPAATSSHPQPSPTSPSVTKSNSSSSEMIMSNPVNGATNSVVVNNNTTKAVVAQTVNGMSSTSPASPHTTQGPIANKMGSRRIFSPHFKIQVLESYRNDSDCKGNQRATARKYGIHRRQIQKWLQCETALRTSVSSNGVHTTAAPCKNGGANMSNSSSSSSDGSPGSSHSHSASVDSNNNQHHHNQRPKALSTSSNNPARHNVVVVDESVALLAGEETVSGGRTTRESGNRQNSMEFFSPPTPTTTSLMIINGRTEAVDGGDRKMESMNEAVPIKPEFSFTSSPSASPCANTTTGNSSSTFEMPAMLRQQQQHQFMIHPISGGVTSVEEDVLLAKHPHHPILPALPPHFISTIYGPLAFPALSFDYPVLSGLHQHLLSPIDLSVGNAERRHAILDHDAQVPTRNGGAHEESVAVKENAPSGSSATAAPMDLSCGRKRKSSGAENAKPPKLFKPYLLDTEDQEDEEELKVVDEEDVRSTASTTKEDSFLDQDLTGLKDNKLGHRLEYPTAVYAAAAAAAAARHHHHGYPESLYEGLYYGHENLTMYPSPRQLRYESSPLHHPSRPASLSSESASPSSPASSSSDPRASPLAFNPWAFAAHDMRTRASVF